MVITQRANNKYKIMYTYIKYISGQYLVYRKHTFCLRTVYNADHRSLAEITKLPKTESC